MNSTHVIVLLFLASLVSATDAANIEHVVDFSHYVSDSDNDLVNRFGNTTGFFQSAVVGLTGDGIVPPDRHDTYIVFKDRAAIIRGTKVTATIDFHFDPAAGNPNSDYVPIQIVLEAGRSIQVDVLRNRGNPDPKLRIAYSFSEVRPAVAVSLNKGWFRLTAELIFVGGVTGDDVLVNGTLESVSTTDPAIVVGRVEHKIADYSLGRSTSCTVNLRAARWGGTTALDNFLLRVADRSLDFIQLQPKLTFSIIIDAAVGRTFLIERAASAEGPWNPVEIVTISKQPQSWIDQSPLVNQKFYRAVIVP